MYARYWRKGLRNNYLFAIPYKIRIYARQCYPMSSGIGMVYERVDCSCIPNVICDFSTSSFSLQFIALKAIKAGGQLFYSYVSTSECAEVRQKRLAPYGIICECHACANATPQSDSLHLWCPHSSFLTCNVYVSDSFRLLVWGHSLDIHFMTTRSA